jgi:hypothetical protein
LTFQIRTAILRDVTIPRWLRNGTLYGEGGSDLELDSLLIRAAALQSKSTTLLGDENLVLPSDVTELKIVAIEAQELDVGFQNWPSSLPEDWLFTLHTSKGSDSTSGLLYEGSVHRYKAYGHAAVWNRYRAVRIIVNDIHLQLLSRLPQNPSLITQVETCQKNVGSLATDLCYSVPVFFSSNPASHDSVSKSAKSNRNILDTQQTITPMMATVIAWPVTVAISTEAVPNAQKQWLQSKLKTIAGVVGASVLHSIADTGEFESSTM